MPMTDSPLVTNAMKGALLGAAFGYFSVSISRRPAGERNVLRYGAYGAGLGALVSLFLDSRAAALADRLPIVVVPPSPIVTKGYFAGAPRPLYHTHDAHAQWRSHR